MQLALLSKRQKEILCTLREFGYATARQIAAKTGLSVNGLNQTLNALSGEKFILDGKEYQLCNRMKEKITKRQNDADVINWYLVEK